MPVDLPDAKASDKKQEQKEVDIYVTKDGTYHLDKAPISEAELDQRISELPKETTVVLRSDKDATFQNFVTVMDILKKYKHEQLYIVTKE